MRQARVVGAALVAALLPVARAWGQEIQTKSAPSPAEADVIVQEQRALESFVKGSPGGFADAIGGTMEMVSPTGGFTLTPQAIARMMAACTTTSYTGQDFRATTAGADVVVLTYEARMDYVCAGKRFTPGWHALSVWQRREGRWYAVAHSQTPASPNLTQETQRVRDAAAAVAGAESARDLERVLSYYTDDAVAQAAGAAALVGKPALRRHYQALFASSFVELVASTTDVEVAASGDLAWEQGINRLTRRGASGPELEVGKYLAVWRKEAGAWKIAAIAVTADGAPLPAALPGASR